MALKDLFKKTYTEPAVEQKVDPIVEQRRKEKFSQPLIYSEEFEEPVGKPAKPKTQTTSSHTTTTTTTPSTKKTMKVAKPKVESGYQMSEVISPIYGRREEPKKAKPKTTTAKKKVSQKPIEDQLVPIISPFYGADINGAHEKAVEEPAAVEQPTKTQTTTPTRRSQRRAMQVNKEPETVTEDLRNIANMVQEGENELKLVEKRTGEFQFDFSKMKSEEPSLIDEIDDAMTLDELMSLYEKKFKGDEE